MASSERRGNCYVCVEALYHLLGGAKSGWTPHTVRHEGDVHWYLAKRLVPPAWSTYNHDRGGVEAPVLTPCLVVLDPTWQQFKTPPPYDQGRGRGFLTRGPSKRARALMDQMLWQESKPKRRR